MSTQFSRIVSLILEKSLDAICSASVVYLAMVYNTLDKYNDDRDLAERAVEEALKEINDSDRKYRRFYPRDKDSECLTHDKTWKENVFEFEKVAKRILSTLGEIWKNPAFETSMSRNEQSEVTYILDVIMPLLRATLRNLPNGYLFKYC
ncbi:hypothetical protein F8M41_011131 [Gigaspora margarita]|uniref:Uncharacterized protein n=1 Tax=Gigaspora margarita TaxID=4874 RepID=A0A8H3X0E9_GIGMA|nr:hypothetical protein F8M41_011131 [Gigaspora margarita]